MSKNKKNGESESLEQVPAEDPGTAESAELALVTSEGEVTPEEKKKTVKEVFYAGIYPEVAIPGVGHFKRAAKGEAPVLVEVDESIAPQLVKNKGFKFAQ